MPRLNGLRPRRSTLILVLAVAALTFPLAVLANHQFSDVPSSASYHDDVEALVDAGITNGCGGGKFCPSSSVTRGQLAQFLNRLGSLDGSTPPSVDADKIDGIDSSGFLKTGTIVTAVDGGAWEPHVTSPTHADRYITNVEFSGDGIAVLPLTAPSVVGTTTYGLASLQICVTSVFAGAFIDQIEIYRMDSTGSAFLVFLDATDRGGSKGCFTVSPNLAVGEGLGLAVLLGGGADAFIRLGNVETTWSSEGTFTVTEIGPADPAMVGPDGD